MSERAPTTKAIRNFKGNFREATKSIVETAGWTNVTLERAQVTLKATVRKEITFDLGEAANEEVLESGTHVYDFFNARLRIRIVTGRREGNTVVLDEARDLHESFVADTLDIFAEEKNPFTEAILPYYAVKMIQPLGTKSDLDVINFEDYTDIDFAIQFGIRSTAWPIGY